MSELENTKIRQKESTYRKLYSSLLQRKKDEVSPAMSSIGFFNNNNGGTESEDERQLLSQVVRTETSNLFFGIATTATIFAMLRLGPTRIVQQMGGERARAMRQAELDAKRLGTAGVQQRIAIFVEGAFSMWAGFRAYDFASQQSTSSYDTFSKLPLCKGKSHIATALCPEWIDITNRQIPSEFWQAHKAGALRDDQTWTAIRQFSLNCEKRQAFERRVRLEQNIASDSPVLLPTQVPENILELNAQDQ